jgi:hypothetical protein
VSATTQTKPVGHSRSGFAAGSSFEAGRVGAGFNGDLDIICMSVGRWQKSQKWTNRAGPGLLVVLIRERELDLCANRQVGRPGQGSAVMVTKVGAVG